LNTKGNERKLYYIRNPTTYHIKEWYLSRTQSYCRRHRNCEETKRRLSTEEQRHIEELIKEEAIKDLLTYIYKADKSRKFNITFIEMEKDKICGCRCEKGLWWLYSFNSNTDIINKKALIKHPLNLNVLSEYANNINTLGIIFLESIKVMHI
jgi:hypothetical protein